MWMADLSLRGNPKDHMILDLVGLADKLQIAFQSLAS
jgi:hypothetical protein